MDLSDALDALDTLISEGSCLTGEGSCLTDEGRLILIDLIRGVDYAISYLCEAAEIEEPDDYDAAYRVIAGNLMGHGVAIADNWTDLSPLEDAIDHVVKHKYGGLLDDTGGGALYSFVA